VWAGIRVCSRLAVIDRLGTSVPPNANWQNTNLQNTKPAEYQPTEPSTLPLERLDVSSWKQNAIQIPSKTIIFG